MPLAPRPRPLHHAGPHTWIAYATLLQCRKGHPVTLKVDMKTIVLSDHTSDMIARQQGLRKRDYDSVLNSYRRAEVDWSRKVNTAYRRAVEDHQDELERWSSMSWFRRLSYGITRGWPLFLLNVAIAAASLFAFVSGIANWLALIGVVLPLGVALLFFPSQRPKLPTRPQVERRIGGPPQRPVLSAERSDDEVIWEAGNEGERRVSERLSAQLDDQWTMLSGYRGPGGEIDRILVGPFGACALEIKFLNGNVSVFGDTWTITRYDNYDNIVDQAAPVKDASGHSPSGQVNTAVKPLEAFLARRNVLGRMGRAVVLSHDKSGVRRVSNQTVDHITTLGTLKVRELFSRTQPLSSAAAAKVVQNIQRDHEFHKNRRNRSRKGRRGGRALST